MNDLDLCLEVVTWSRQPLRYIWRWISWKPLEKFDSKGLPIGNGVWAIEWSCDRWRHVTQRVLCGSTVGYPIDSLASCPRCLFTLLKISDEEKMKGRRKIICQYSVGRPIKCAIRIYRCRCKNTKFYNQMITL